MQGKDTNIIIFVVALRAFKSKLEKKVEMQNCIMFEKLDILFHERPEGIPDHIKNGIQKHLSALESELERYFPETTNEHLDLVRNSFKYPFEKLADDCQEKFLEQSMIRLHTKNMKRNFCHNSGSG